jgi:hypothetical protein
MSEVQVTYLLAARFYWAIMWRSVLGCVPVVVMLLVVHLTLQSITNSDAMQYLPIEKVFMFPFLLAITIWVVKGQLGATFGKVRLTAIHVES